MKANDGSGNNELRDEWQTPQALFNTLDEQYEFTLDCCANGKNKKATFWTSDFQDYLSEQTNNVAWMNPPFSKANEMFKHFFKVVNRGVAIYRCDNFETKLWQDIIFSNADWIFIPNKRVVYEGLNGGGARFPSALIGWRVRPPKGLKGTVLLPKKEVKE